MIFGDECVNLAVNLSEDFLLLFPFDFHLAAPVPLFFRPAAEPTRRRSSQTCCGSCGSSRDFLMIATFDTAFVMSNASSSPPGMTTVAIRPHNRHATIKNALKTPVQPNASSIQGMCR